MTELQPMRDGDKDPEEGQREPLYLPALSPYNTLRGLKKHQSHRPVAFEILNPSNQISSLTWQKAYAGPRYYMMTEERTLPCNGDPRSEPCYRLNTLERHELVEGTSTQHKDNGCAQLAVAGQIRSTNVPRSRFISSASISAGGQSVSAK
ncbi:hypothetical protein CISG_03691 [Coccidioides immitis RMSCC 3703]|uniref:Uncharacterized protein n=1 Tax=Coccidioides immitis RMSCC 3703 TaxID=454286 RepID=A0A0J8QMG6_COCIT|nr:hypothetical protein CISG_03691 [Coccidioides immitis RMSCC 3703]